MSLQSKYYESLAHHGIKGQKWGVRRFETKDGHLTPAGKERYGDDNDSRRSRKEDKKALKAAKKIKSAYENAGDSMGRADYYKSKGDEAAKKYEDNERVLRKAAAQYDKEGKVLKAEAARRTADWQKAKGEKAREEWNEKVKAELEEADYYKQKASKISTKKNVELGRSTVDKILKDSRAKGMKDAKDDDEYDRWLRGEEDDT